MNIYQWANKHNVSPDAVAELLDMYVAQAPQETVKDTPALSEAAVQQRVRLEAAKKGIRIWRNNVGVLTDDRGVPVRYGLANDSKAVNSMIKSSDLIGIRPVTITPDMVGRVIGQFVAREIKAEGWRYSGNVHEAAQLRYLELVTGMGGDGQFATGVGTL